jgi:hypothetical protein
MTGKEPYAADMIPRVLQLKEEGRPLRKSLESHIASRLPEVGILGSMVLR